MDDTTTTEARLDLEAINQRRQAASDMVHALCQPRGTAGAREWMMSIPARSDVDPDLIIHAALQDNAAMALAVDRLTAERDWYRAGLHGISKGHYADPAEHAAGALKWVGEDTPNPVDRLRETVAALVTALAGVQMPDNECCPICGDFRLRGPLPGGHKSWCPMAKVDVALALAAASHGDNGAVQKGPTT